MTEPTDAPDPTRRLTRKGERTRARILESALTLFREHGYQETTMRIIAAHAEVALGNAYYYFRSKEHLIQAFYMRTHEEHLSQCEPILRRETEVEARLLGVMRAKVASIEPYHRFAGVLFRTAADPESPLNPFSDESEPTRTEATALFARVLDGKGLRVSKELAAELPHLLWLYHMGVILFWIHDRTAGRERTRRMVEETAPMVLKVAALGSLPLVRGLVRGTVDFLREMREDA